MTTQVSVDYVSLICCVLTYNFCSYKVMWLFNKVKMKKGKDVILKSQNSCNATLETVTSHKFWRKNTLLTCEVQYDQRVKTFPLEAPGENHLREAPTSSLRI